MPRLTEWEVRASARTSLTEQQVDALGAVLAVWHGAAGYNTSTERLSMAATVWAMEGTAALNRITGGIRAWARREGVELPSMRFDVRLVK